MSNKQYVSYDVESLLIKVPVHKTTEHIINETYVKNKLPKLYSKLTFPRLLLKLTTEKTFMLNRKFYKQVDVYSIWGPLSVILFNIYTTKTERKLVEPTKSQFYKIIVDDIINKRYKNQPDNLFQALSNNHPKIKYAVELDPDKFLNTKIIQRMVLSWLKLTGKIENDQYIGHPESQSSTKEIQLQVTWIECYAFQVV